MGVSGSRTRSPDNGVDGAAYWQGVDVTARSRQDDPGRPGGHLGVTLQDLELPPRKDVPKEASAATIAQLAGPIAPGQAGAQPGVSVPRITEEILPGGEPLGQNAFAKDGLVGTEPQQLQLLAHYADLCEDFRLYQKKTRAEGAPMQVDGAQLLVLSGPPGTGKTKHAVSFARALGLPLLIANPPQSSQSTGGNAVPAATWAAQLKREVRGRDCAIFMDEIDHHITDEGSASALRQFLDGVCQPSENRVLVVGTTNRIGVLPKDVLHRAEVVSFDRPETTHLEGMWGQYAQHLGEAEFKTLAEVSKESNATGRDVRHCASLCERRSAIKYLHQNGGQGYCHGAGLANCPAPLLTDYIQCVSARAVE